MTDTTAKHSGTTEFTSDAMELLSLLRQYQRLQAEYAKTRRKYVGGGKDNKQKRAEANAKRVRSRKRLRQAMKDVTSDILRLLVMQNKAALEANMDDLLPLEDK